MHELETLGIFLIKVDAGDATVVDLVFEPAWDQSMMSEEARVELRFIIRIMRWAFSPVSMPMW